MATQTTARPPLPPFTRESAIQKVRLAEDGWNTRDPAKVALAYAIDSRWWNRLEFISGRSEIIAFLSRKWATYRDVIRAKVVLLAAQGLSNDVIATRLDTPRQIVSKRRKRFALMRLPGLEEQPRGGRPTLFSPQRRRSSKGPRL